MLEVIYTKIMELFACMYTGLFTIIGGANMGELYTNFITYNYYL